MALREDVRGVRPAAPLPAPQRTTASGWCHGGRRAAHTDCLADAGMPTMPRLRLGGRVRKRGTRRPDGLKGEAEASDGRNHPVHQDLVDFEESASTSRGGVVAVAVPGLPRATSASGTAAENRRPHPSTGETRLRATSPAVRGAQHLRWRRRADPEGELLTFRNCPPQQQYGERHAGQTAQRTTASGESHPITGA